MRSIFILFTVLSISTSNTPYFAINGLPRNLEDVTVGCWVSNYYIVLYHGSWLEY